MQDKLEVVIREEGFHGPGASRTKHRIGFDGICDEIRFISTYSIWVAFLSH